MHTLEMVQRIGPNGAQLKSFATATKGKGGCTEQEKEKRNWQSLVISEIIHCDISWEPQQALPFSQEQLFIYDAHNVVLVHYSTACLRNTFTGATTKGLYGAQNTAEVIKHWGFTIAHDYCIRPQIAYCKRGKSSSPSGRALLPMWRG